MACPPCDTPLGRVSTIDRGVLSEFLEPSTGDYAFLPIATSMTTQKTENDELHRHTTNPAESATAAAAAALVGQLETR